MWSLGYGQCCRIEQLSHQATPANEDIKQIVVVYESKRRRRRKSPDVTQCRIVPSLGGESWTGLLHKSGKRYLAL